MIELINEIERTLSIDSARSSGSGCGPIFSGGLFVVKEVEGEPKELLHIVDMRSEAVGSLEGHDFGLTRSRWTPGTRPTDIESFSVRETDGAVHSRKIKVPSLHADDFMTEKDLLGALRAPELRRIG